MNFECVVRSANHGDRLQIQRLIENNPLVHRHLDWSEPLSWIGSAPYKVLERGGRIAAALACPPDAARVAWLRLFAINEEELEHEAWRLLWDAARLELEKESGLLVAAILMRNRWTNLLEGSGFSSRQELVMLEKEGGGGVSETAVDGGVTIRGMVAHDLPAVVAVDGAAFAPPWQNMIEELGRAHARAFLASVAEVDGRIIGYQISTRTSIGAHLARLAVFPESQGRGIGLALLEDLFSQSGARGIWRFTVNTQSDNAASLHLYKKNGFVETGERYPVFEFRVA